MTGGPFTISLRLPAVVGPAALVMGGYTDQIEVRRIGLDECDWQRALHVAMGVRPPPDGAAPAREVAELLSSARREDISIDLLFGAYRGGELVCACVVVETPGSAALTLMPGYVGPGDEQGSAVSLLRAAQAGAWQRPIKLLEILVAPDSVSLGRALSEAGFHYLTRLLYLHRRCFTASPGLDTCRDLEWVGYSPDTEALFERALSESYLESQDCPELTGIRPVSEVLASHRATGLFDPAFWWVATRRGEPVGVLLLSRVRGAEIFEIVYIGVVPPVRGTGVSDALLKRALDLAVQAGVRTVSLGVDQRNTAARRMYSRWGFVEAGSRDAWIATRPGT